MVLVGQTDRGQRFSLPCNPLPTKVIIDLFVGLYRVFPRNGPSGRPKQIILSSSCQRTRVHFFKNIHTGRYSLAHVRVCARAHSRTHTHSEVVSLTEKPALISPPKTHRVEGDKMLFASSGRPRPVSVPLKSQLVVFRHPGSQHARHCHSALTYRYRQVVATSPPPP